MKTILGLDFGTTTTVIAQTTPESKFGPELIEVDGRKRVETVVRLDSAGEKVERIGEEAWEELTLYPGRTFFDFKPYIGMEKTYRIGSRVMSAFDLSVLFLEAVRKKMEQQHFCQKALAEMDVISNVGYPAEWSAKQKATVVEAVRKAGFPNVTGCEEPLGAVYYHHFKGDISFEKVQLLLVYDFGGGTTDVSIVRVRNDRALDILGFGGTNIGGHHIDDKLTKIFSGEVFGDANAVLPPHELARIRKASRRIKEKLSNDRSYGSDQTAEIIIRMLMTQSDSYRMTLDVKKFETHCKECINRFKEPVIMAVKQAGIEMSEIQTIILAGGAGRLYYAKEKLNEMFPPPQINIQTASPQEVIAMGLALFGRERLRPGPPPEEEPDVAEEEKEPEDGHEDDPGESDVINKKPFPKKILFFLTIVLVSAISGISYFFMPSQSSCPDQFRSIKAKFREVKGVLDYKRVFSVMRELNDLEDDCESGMEEVNELKILLNAELERIETHCRYETEKLENEYKEATPYFGIMSDKELLKNIRIRAMRKGKQCNPESQEILFEIVSKCDKKLD